MENVTVSGWKILVKEVLNSSMPTTKMMMEMTKLTMYSVRPWPNG